MVEDDEEQMKEELKEAFRIYDKEVSKNIYHGSCPDLELPQTLI